MKLSLLLKWKGPLPNLLTLKLFGRPKNSLKNQTSYHYKIEKTVQIVFMLDVKKKKRFQISMMLLCFPTSFLISLTSEIGGFIHALIYIWTSVNNQVRGAQNLIMKVHKIVGNVPGQIIILVYTVPSYKKRIRCELRNIQEFVSYLN